MNVETNEKNPRESILSKVLGILAICVGVLPITRAIFADDWGERVSGLAVGLALITFGVAHFSENPKIKKHATNVACILVIIFCLQRFL